MAAKQVLLSSICAFLGYFICMVQAGHFELWYGPLPCILLDIDATFYLSDLNKNATPFSIEGASVTVEGSTCRGTDRAAKLSLRLFPSNESLNINFRRVISTQSVSMSVALLLDPKEHFENATEIPFELEDSADLPIGLMNMSYRCNSQQEILFNQNLLYKMTMKITNLHVQAYNMKNGQFSPDVIVCPADDNNNFSNGNDNRTRLVVLISACGSILVIAGVTLTALRCKKIRKSSDSLSRKLLANKTHENYESNDIVKGSDEYLEASIKRDTKQQVNKISDLLLGTSEIDEVSGRYSQQYQRNSSGYGNTEVS